MSIYELAISKLSREELAEFVREKVEEAARYEHAFLAAKAFIDCRETEQGISHKLHETFDEYRRVVAWYQKSLERDQ